MKYRNKNLKLFTSIIVVALVVVGVMIFQACKKEKEFECKDSFKPTFQEINKFSDFAKNCHNSALDVILPAAMQNLERGKEPNYDSIASLVTNYTKNKFAEYCDVQIDEELSSKIECIEYTSKDFIFDTSAAISDDSKLIDYLDTKTELSIFEKNTILQIMEICNDSVYKSRRYKLAQLKQELIDMRCESEILHYVVSVAQGSNDYWEEHACEYISNKYLFGAIMGKLVKADFKGALIGAIQGGLTGCSTAMIFGPGGYVTCVGGALVWSAIYGSGAAAVIMIYDALSK